MIADSKEFRQMALGLANKGVIPIFGDMNNDLEEIVIESILLAREKDHEKALLLINSSGGNNTCFSAIKATMLQSGMRFDGLVMGRAHSNAFMILQQCSNRQAVRDARLSFHWGQQTFGNQQLCALIQGETWPIEHALNVEIATAEQVSERTGVSIETLKEWALYEREFTAPEALEFALIDEILPDLPRSLKDKLEKKA